jgi:hypothetical protein
MTRTYEYPAKLRLIRTGKESDTPKKFKVELILSKQDLFDIQQKILKTELEHISLKVD